MSMANAIGSIVGAGGSYLGGKAKGDAAERASNAQIGANMAALQLQKSLADRSRSDLAPWRQTGQQAMDMLWSKYQSGDFKEPTVSAEDLAADPSYKFRFDEGQKAIERSAAARGNLLSGAQLKGVQRYGQDMGSQEYGNIYNRKVADQNRQYNILAGLSNTGQSAASGQAGINQQLGRGGSALLSGAGAARAGGYTGQGNAQAGMYGGASTAINQGLQNWLVEKNTGGGGGGGGAYAGSGSGRIRMY